MAVAWPLLTALLLVGGLERRPTVRAESPDPLGRLLAWTTSLGADVSGVSIDGAGSHRRLLATRAFQPGDAILRMPRSAALPLPCNEVTGGGAANATSVQSAAECARPLLLRMHSDPSFHRTWGVLWAVQPAPGETLTPVAMDASLRGMLQHPELEALVGGYREDAVRVYDGTHYSPAQPPLGALAPVSLPLFLHVASLIASRSFTPLPVGADGSSPGIPASFLLPVVEFINHADTCLQAEADAGSSSAGSAGSSAAAGSGSSAANASAQEAADRAREGLAAAVDVLPPEPACAVAGFPLLINGSFELRALLPIAAGQEVTFDYHRSLLHRPDISLLIYGFTTPRRRPLLAAVDLPGFRQEEVWSQTAPDDAAHEDPSSGLVSAAELQRLQGILAALPTTEAEDEALLQGVTDWRERAVLQFRVLRKRALRQTIERLQVALAAREAASEEAAAAAPSHLLDAPPHTEL